MTYNVFSGTLNPTQSIDLEQIFVCFQVLLWHQQRVKQYEIGH